MDSIAEMRERLPIFKCKAEILEKIAKSKTTIFMGETGSGKTTQIPQYLLEAGYTRHKCIAVTQPRRVGAISMAKRVAMEVKTELGVKVGYSVRFDVCSSAATKIKFLTDGTLLRESIKDNLFMKYSVVILDEAHERTLNNDILLGIVKLAQRKREEKHLPHLKIIVMSATLDHNHFSKYFDDSPVYSIPGRNYEIEILQTKKQTNYVRAALATVFKIHQNEEKGDILVFCTGQEEIDYMVSETIEIAKLLPADIEAPYPCALYAALPFEQQLNAFKPAPAGERKVIFSTNIAETSVTIPNIKYVVDTGMAKVKSYNSSGFGVLLNQRISKAQAIQRCGRAGRESEGKCYRLYSDEEYRNFKEHTEPEILRCCLANVILQMVAMGIKNVAEFDFIDKPSAENISAAINILKLLDAVIEKEGILELTECGQKMVVFPLDPRFSKIIIESTKYGCTDEILTIVSLLSIESIFFTKTADREQFRKVREKFETHNSDLLTMLEAYKEFKRKKGNKRKYGSQELDKHAWCKENFINVQNMNKCVAIRKQLSALCKENDIPPINCRDLEQIKKCLVTGFFMNVALQHDREKYKVIENDQEVKIHPSSCLFKRNAICCIYTELVQTTNIYMRNVTYVDKAMLLHVKPDYFKTKMCRLAV